MAVDLSYMGIKKGTRVGLCGANSVGWIICFFALQKLGAMTVLLNFAHKPAEIARIIALNEAVKANKVISFLSGQQEKTEQE